MLSSKNPTRTEDGGCSCGYRAGSRPTQIGCGHHPCPFVVPCRGVVCLKGKIYRCDLPPEHTTAHANFETGTMWDVSWTNR